MQVIYARTLEVWVFFTVLLSFATHVLSCILAGAWPSISSCIQCIYMYNEYVYIHVHVPVVNVDSS